MFRAIQDRVESIEHWELLTLMLLTCGAIVGLYSGGLLFVWALLGGPDWRLVFGVGIGVAILVSGIQFLRRMHYHRQRGSPLPPKIAPAIHDTADRLADEFGISRPEVRVLDNENPNAYAVGRRGDGIVFFNKGLLDTLDQEEIEAVLAHEMAHLKSRDSLVVSMANSVRLLMRRATWIFAMCFAFFGTVMAAMLTDGGKKQARKHARRRQMIVAGTTLFVSGIVLLFSRALSRYREYVADVTAARALNDPGSMKRALRSIDAATDGGATVEDDSVAPLYIINDVETRFAALFASHPDTDDRIEVVDSAFEGETENPMAEGAVLGRFTKFGLTVAPAVIVGMSVLIFVANLFATSSTGGTSLVGVGTVVILSVVGLLWFASLAAFPWAMLFADGGRPIFGFTFVVFVLLTFFSEALLPDVLLLRHVDLLAYLGSTLVAALHLQAVVREVL